MTQADLAGALDWSLSKVNRIESGEVTISNMDLTGLLSFLNVTDDELVGRLNDDARASRRRGWWDESTYREHLTPATRQLLQFETEASAIRCFHPYVLPGPLQVRRYAEAIFKVTPVAEVDRVARVDARLRRFEHIFARPNPPQYLLILDESVLLREVGGPEVMVEQLDRLRDYMQRELIKVRLVPLAETVAYAIVGPFVILDLGEDEQSAVLYRETVFEDEIIQQKREILAHRRIFDEVWRNTLAEEPTKRIVNARLAVLLASLDRRRPTPPEDV